MEKIIDITFDEADLAKPIDLKTIAKKNYTSFEELNDDFDWYIHNLLVQHRSNKNVTKAAKELKQMLHTEIENILLCYQCYRSVYNHPELPITQICEPPRMLLWVDCAEYSLYPAKLIRLENNDHATIRYFGDWTTATVSLEKCFMFSEEIPENSHGAGTGPTFLLAKKV